MEEFDLVWIEEPLDAYDAQGHAALAASLDTPIATGEMLASVAEHYELIRHNAADIIQPDAPRIGGITQFLKLAALAEHHNLRLAPHFAMEIHLHLAAAYPIEPWVEHFDWLEPLFNERLTISRVGRRVPAHAGALGKALLAERTDSELPLSEGPLAALTENTHTDRVALLADLAGVRERGYSIDHEETVTGIAGFGFALRCDTPAVDAISCSVPVARLTGERQEHVVAVMRDIQTKIEALLSPRSGAPDWR
jgi:hypothetical protein